MSITHTFPDQAKVKKMLGMLFGDDMKITPADPLPTNPDSDGLVAVYLNDEGAPSTACVCDRPFAAYSGAALSMIPRGGAEDAAKSGELSDMMRSNLHEIMNICSRLFMNDSTPHLKLGTLYEKLSDLPVNARAMVDAASGRSDFMISIPGYGEGQITFLTT